MFVAEGPGSNDLLSNSKKRPGVAGHQMLHRRTNNLISWNVSKIKKAKRRI